MNAGNGKSIVVEAKKNALSRWRCVIAAAKDLKMRGICMHVDWGVMTWSGRPFGRWMRVGSVDRECIASVREIPRWMMVGQDPAADR